MIIIYLLPVCTILGILAIWFIMAEEQMKEKPAILIYCVTSFGIGYLIGTLLYNLMRK